MVIMDYGVPAFLQEYRQYEKFLLPKKEVK